MWPFKVTPRKCSLTNGKVCYIFPCERKRLQKGIALAVGAAGGREGGGGRGAEADRRACQTVRGFLWVVVMSPVFTFFIPFIYIF